MHWNTVTPLVREILEGIMNEEAFDEFRLVGGTALSLQLGHRESVDIDLFSDAEYGAINFKTIDAYFKRQYAYVDSNTVGGIGIGTSYFVGPAEAELVKVDIYYTDAYINEPIIDSDVRMADVEEIIAMKLEVLGYGGRKKDFWDLHACHNQYDLPSMIDFYKKRYPYGHSHEVLCTGFINFTNADDDFDPVCLLGKHWELIKFDLMEWVNQELPSK